MKNKPTLPELNMSREHPPAGVTERITIPLKGSLEEWRDPFKQLLIALKHAPGFTKTRWGPWMENPQMLDIMCGWLTKGMQETFTASQTWQDALAVMAPALNGPIERTWIRFVPYQPRDAVNAPVCEMITYRDCDGDEDEMRTTLERCKEYEGSRGCASGYSMDDADGAADDGGAGSSTSGGGGASGGKRGRMFVGALGWESLEASRAANKEDYYPKVGVPEVHHVYFDFPMTGFSGAETN